MKKYWKDNPSEKSEDTNNATPKTPGKTFTFSGLINNDDNILPASRRDFLKLCGFSFAAAALASCKQKITRAIPYVIAPEELIPGNVNYYASSYINGSDYCSILVKNRDGRPIKIEGNPASSVTTGGTSARVQASVLDLYDGSRFQRPAKNGDTSSWEVVDKEIMDQLNGITGRNGTIVLLTPTIFSPSAEAVISAFLKRYPGSEWIQYDAISYSAILEANRESFGIRAIPDYRFDKADLIVSLGADFLGTWLSPVEYAAQFSSRREPGKEMNTLIQLESNLSLTGCNADKRVMMKPSEEIPALLNIYSNIMAATGGRKIYAPDSSIDVTEISDRILSSKGRSLVISGSNNRQVQILVNEINRASGNIGNTILFNSFLRTHAALDRDMLNLVSRMNKGEINALLVWNVNPAYTWFDGKALRDGIEKVELTVSLSGSPDETSTLMKYSCPDHHFLESWNDAEPRKNHFSLMQPVINPLFDTRQGTETLLKWSGSEKNYYDFLKDHWSENLMKLQREHNEPGFFFDAMLQKGVFETAAPDVKTGTLSPSIDPSTFRAEEVQDGGYEVVIYETVAIGEGRQSNNPWLQELPDPVTKICWDNYASLSPAMALESGLSEFDVIDLGGIEVPVHIQPGQANGTIGVSLGYGRRNSGPVGTGIGSDAWPLLKSVNDNIVRATSIGKIQKTGKHINYFARTQSHHTMEGRALVREAGLTEFLENPEAGNEMHEEIVRHNESLYPEWEYPHHHWGMAVDLTRCTGCSACVIACQAENNVPVVGREEVYRVHEMHWLRIDRYYSGDENNPEVLFQPVLCQHCKNAPCENVCPVAATNHSSEGLNQMIYNRCFGTRYCNNNCPYKVRRFNWFNYTDAGTLRGNLRDTADMTGDLRRMVLNPDVTVRAQGVIEKCSFCIQRIQAGKLKAKIENRPLRDGEIQTACAQACPANAIIFGDMNDNESELRKLMASGRRYNLLEELFTQPSVHYLTKIRNKSI